MPLGCRTGRCQHCSNVPFPATVEVRTHGWMELWVSRRRDPAHWDSKASRQPSTLGLFPPPAAFFFCSQAAEPIKTCLF